jgi:hypothetical protein
VAMPGEPKQLTKLIDGRETLLALLI